MFTKGQLNRVLKWEKNMANLSACADGTHMAPAGRTKYREMPAGVIGEVVLRPPSPIAQMADIGFKVVLLERLNQKWKQNHLQNPCNENKNQGGDHVENCFVLILFLLFLFLTCVGFSTHVWEFPNR